MDWHKADVIAALHKKGVSLNALSIANGLAPSTLRNVFRLKYPKAERIIASELGVEPKIIWPSRYES